MAKIDRCRLFHGRPSAHLPAMVGAMEAFAALTVEYDVHAVLVLKGGVVALPRRDTSTAVASKDVRRLDPGGNKPIQEVSLSCDDVLIEIGVS